MESCNIYSFISGSFHLVYLFKFHPYCNIYQYFIIFMGKLYSIVWICHNLFVLSTVDRHLGCFELLATEDNASVNIHVPVFVWDPSSNSFFFFFFLLLLWPLEVPRPGIKPKSQQWPELLQWQWWILNPHTTRELHRSSHCGPAG